MRAGRPRSQAVCIAAWCAMRMTVSRDHGGTRFPLTPAPGRVWEGQALPNPPRGWRLRNQRRLNDILGDQAVPCPPIQHLQANIAQTRYGIVASGCGSVKGAGDGNRSHPG